MSIRLGVAMKLRSLLCVLAIAAGLVPSASRAVSVGYSLADASLGMPGGYFDLGSPDGAARVSALIDIKTYIESVIPNPGTLTIELSVFSDPGAPTLASGGQFFSGLSPTAHGIVMGDSQLELLGGMSIAGANGFLSINSAKAFYLGSDAAAIPMGMSDFRSVVLHEVTHALGFASFMKPDDKTSALTDFLKHFDPVKYAGLGEVFSIYDSLLVDTMGFSLLLPDGSANMAALPMGGALVASPLAIIANGGELVPTAVIPFIDGDLTHLKSSVVSVMNPTLAKGTTERAYSVIDLAILKDLGYVAAPTPPVPEPQTWALMAFGLALLLMRRATLLRVTLRRAAPAPR
jgi:hypothetical protein